MGHRTSLIKTLKEQSKELFEANNSIPFFWLTLIDIETVEKYESEMVKVYNQNEQQSNEQYIEPPTFKISKTDFLTNTIDGDKFISKHFSKELALYRDFITYLNLTFGSDDILELSLIEIANFTNIDNFFKKLKDDVNAIKTDNINRLSQYIGDDIFSNLVGYDRFLADQFKEHSAAYRIAYEKEDLAKSKSIEASKLIAKKEKRSKNKEGILMLLIGVVFMAGCVLGIIKEGFNVNTIALFIFSLAIMLFGYFKLKQ